MRILLGDPEAEQSRKRGKDEGIGDAMAGKIRNVLAFYNDSVAMTNVAVHVPRHDALQLDLPLR